VVRVGCAVRLISWCSSIVVVVVVVVAGYHWYFVVMSAVNKKMTNGRFGQYTDTDIDSSRQIDAVALWSLPQTEAQADWRFGTGKLQLWVDSTCVLTRVTLALRQTQGKSLVISLTHETAKIWQPGFPMGAESVPARSLDERLMFCLSCLSNADRYTYITPIIMCLLCLFLLFVRCFCSVLQVKCRCLGGFGTTKPAPALPRPVAFSLRAPSRASRIATKTPPYLKHVD
jgi:hypothetical protein